MKARANTVDLHELANCRGYGVAQHILAQAGLRDPADENGQRQYLVRVVGRIDASLQVWIRAGSREEAVETAVQKVTEGDVTWSDFDDLPMVTDAYVTEGWHE